jgi:hypothetical protein
VTIERRRHPRFPLLVQITVHQNDEDFVMEMLDLSRGGARVDLGSAARPDWVNLRREVELHAPSAEGSITLKGTIVRIVEELEHREFAVQLHQVLDVQTLSAVTGVAVSPAMPPPLPKRQPTAAPPLPQRQPAAAPPLPHRRAAVAPPLPRRGL